MTENKNRKESMAGIANFMYFNLVIKYIMRKTFLFRKHVFKNHRICNIAMRHRLPIFMLYKYYII